MDPRQAKSTVTQSPHHREDEKFNKRNSLFTVLGKVFPFESLVLCPRYVLLVLLRGLRLYGSLLLLVVGAIIGITLFALARKAENDADAAQERWLINQRSKSRTM